MRYLLILILNLVIFSACAPENPKRQPPSEVNAVEALDPGTLTAEAESKVDILFVVDDSASMNSHQRNLSANIRNFTEQVEKSTLLDFHIAVTTVSDSQIKGELRNRRITDPALSSREIVVNRLGQLIPLKDPGTGMLLEGPRYVSRETDRFSDVLAATLLVGAKPGPDQKNATIIGPWFEELFAPVRYVLRNASEPLNQGFYRPEAVFAVVFITDADDDSRNENASDLYSFLLAQKKDPAKVQAYAAIIPSGVSGCRRDDSQEPKKIEEFISLFQNKEKRILNLCSNTFGAKLAEFGKDLADRIPPKIISFPKVPERDSIHVYYGDDLLEEKKHYFYSVGPPGTPHRIIMSKEFDVKLKKGAHFRVEYVPIRPENQTSGRTRKI
jgi:hypothetical protein